MNAKTNFIISFFGLCLLIILISITEIGVLYIAFNSFPLIIFFSPLLLLPILLCKVAYFSLIIQKKIGFADHLALKKIYMAFKNRDRTTITNIDINIFTDLEKNKKYLLHTAWLMHPKTKIALGLFIVWLIWLIALLSSSIGGFGTILFCICLLLALLTGAQSLIETL